MKTTLLILGFCLLCFNSYGQQPGKPMNFVTIEKVDSATKKETLYFNGIEWVGKHFANANKVIQISDKEAGLILVKGSFAYKVPGFMLSGSENHTISFMLKFLFKDGKYKLEMSDFKDDVLGMITYDDYDDISPSKNIQKQWKAAQEETKSNIASVHKSIREFMDQSVNW